MSKLLLVAASVVTPIACSLYFSERTRAEKYQNYTPKQIFSSSSLPSREQMVKKLTETPEFDVLIVGGGATGCGVALDAASRGLTVALVEAGDFASGTSSKSTKLIHGGVRYLERAFWRLDWDEFRLVMEALHDRKYMLNSAPHLASELPLMLPVYSWWKAIYFWFGIKAYDLVALGHSISSSYFMGREKSIRTFPNLKSDSLVGSIVYYDGQQNDARMNLAIAMTAIKFGATITNYTKVQKLFTKVENDQEVVYAALLRDGLTGQEYQVQAKTLINATGPLTDLMRQQINPKADNICKGSTGVHLVIPEKFCPKNIGLLDPATSDGRVLFVLPWEGRVVVGTTDRPCDVQSTNPPLPTLEEAQFILGEVNKFFRPGVEVTTTDVLSAWSGVRPLVADPKIQSPGKTSTISRNHVIEVKNNTVTISGGKWTTYRSMAQDTVNELLKLPQLNNSVAKISRCYTSNASSFRLHGADHWDSSLVDTLQKTYAVPEDIAQHLSHNYGDQAISVMDITKELSAGQSTSRRLSSKFPFIESEVVYACRKEYAVKAIDVISRRMRLAFLDSEQAMLALPRVVDLMAQELKWDSNRKKAEMKQAVDFLENQMGILMKKQLLQK